MSLVTCTVALAFLSAPAAAAGPQRLTPSGKQLEVTAPPRTEEGSVVVEGRVPQPSTVRVDGGMLPATTLTAADGSFSAEVVLRPAQRNRLRVQAWSGRRLRSARVRVRQIAGQGRGQLNGRVRDLANGSPIAGATIAYGALKTESDTTGRYVLAGVPDGRIALRVRSAGRLTAIDAAEVVDGRGTASDTLLQKLAAPVRVGRSGGSFSGPGWRVVIPRGAVSASISLRLTTMATGGALNGQGAPIFDLAPSGRRLAKPIEVRVDPSRLGLDATRTQLVTVNSGGAGGPRATIRRARVEGGRLVFHLRRLEGAEVWLVPGVGPLDQWGGIGNKCKPFASRADAIRAVLYLRLVLLPFLNYKMGPASRDLYSRYLSGGVATATPYDVTHAAALEQFRSSFYTRNAAALTLSALQVKLGAIGAPELGPPDSPTTRDLADYGVGEDVKIHWGYPYDVPGNVAGNVGSVVIGGVTIPDRRDFSGPLRFVPAANARGVLTSVTLRPQLTLKVLDAVDFCPGGAGAGIEQNATIPLSRLEVTPLSSGGFYGKKIPFKVDVQFGADDFNRDITDLYETNDGDGDGVPERQPWSGASYPLDNCPAKANPGQQDEDGDGAGDECDEQPSPDGVWTVDWEQHVTTSTSLTDVSDVSRTVTDTATDDQLYKANATVEVSRGVSKIRSMSATFVHGSDSTSEWHVNLGFPCPTGSARAGSFTRHTESIDPARASRSVPDSWFEFKPRFSAGRNELDFPFGDPDARQHLGATGMDTRLWEVKMTTIGVSEMCDGGGSTEQDEIGGVTSPGLVWQNVPQDTWAPLTGDRGTYTLSRDKSRTTCGTHGCMTRTWSIRADARVDTSTRERAGR